MPINNAPAIRQQQRLGPKPRHGRWPVGRPWRGRPCPAQRDDLQRRPRIPRKL